MDTNIKIHKGKPIISITDLSKRLEEKITKNNSYFWIEGEVQNLRDTNFHVYFSVVENNYSIKCIIWDSVKTKENIKLENGFKGKFMGKMNYYTAKNDISFVIYSVELEGIGNMYNKLRVTRERCENKGLFSKKKKTISCLKKILLITRFESAAYYDIIHSLEDCHNVTVYVIDSFMQGVNAKQDIIDNLDLAQKLYKKLNFDAVVISRGGGSIEDLWIFNDEDIVEKLSNYEIPTITAIGHDIDNSLCDKVADLSFITPTEFGKYINRLYSRKDDIEKMALLKNGLKDIIEDKIDRYNEKLNLVLNDVNSESMIESYMEKIKNLDFIGRDFKSRIYEKLNMYNIKLDNTKNDCILYMNSLSNITLYNLKKEIVYSNKLIKQDNEYIMDFNGKKYVIRIL